MTSNGIPSALDRKPAHDVRQLWLSGLISNDEYGQWVERRTFAKRAQRRLERTYTERSQCAECGVPVAANRKLCNHHQRQRRDSTNPRSI